MLAGEVAVEVLLEVVDVETTTGVVEWVVIALDVWVVEVIEDETAGGVELLDGAGAGVEEVDRGAADESVPLVAKLLAKEELAGAEEDAEECEEEEVVGSAEGVAIVEDEWVVTTTGDGVEAMEEL